MTTDASSDQDERGALVDEVTLELAELQAATDAVDEAVAERLAINRTDLACLNSLYRRGAMTAGQLADESGLTPGAITTALDRLERASYAQRTRDEVDRRRVLVELTPQARLTAAELYAPVLQAGKNGYARYSLEELRLLRDFLQQARQIQAEHVAFLRTSAPPAGSRLGAEPTKAGAEAADGAATALAGVKAGRLEFRRGAARVTLSADPGMRELYRAEFDGSPPDITVEGGTVAVEYPRRWRSFDWRRAAIRLTLNGSIPWSIEVRGGLANMEADLRLLQLRSFEMTGGAANIEVTLPRPQGTVPVRLSGGAAGIGFHRPAGVPVGARLTGGAAKLQFDRQQLGAFGGLTRLETPGFEVAADRYDIRITGGASSVTIDTV
jgi:DNA-binding MarR family transcriptional regulator